jgi:hypothetical protein
LIRNVNLIF